MLPNRTDQRIQLRIVPGRSQEGDETFRWSRPQHRIPFHRYSGINYFFTKIIISIVFSTTLTTNLGIILKTVQTYNQIVQEEFLEDINNILNSGEVPNLFEKDELEEVMSLVRPHAKDAGISESDRDAVYHHFIAR